MKEFVVGQGGVSTGQGSRNQSNNALPLPLGIIEVIHATSMGVSVSHRRGVLSVVTPPKEDATNQLEKRLRRTSIPIIFGEADLEGTSHPHDDALVMTSQICGFLVKIVMVDQGSGAKIMYPNLYKGLELKLEDLSKYDTPLVGFDGKIVIPERQIKLSEVSKGKEVEVNFIVVNAFSPYTTILGRPWIHAMEVIPSTSHQKIKFPTKDGVAVVRTDQKVARQCLVVAINHEIKQKDQVEMEQLSQLQGTESLSRVDSTRELVQVRILPYTNRYFRIRKSLQVEDRVEVLLSLI